MTVCYSVQYEMLSDITRTRKRSQVGARFTGRNVFPYLTWDTRSTVATTNYGRASGESHYVNARGRSATSDLPKPATGGSSTPSPAHSGHEPNATAAPRRRHHNAALRNLANKLHGHLRQRPAHDLHWNENTVGTSLPNSSPLDGLYVKRCFRPDASDLGSRERCRDDGT